MHPSFLLFISVLGFGKEKKKNWEGVEEKEMDVSPQTCDLCSAHSWK